MALRNSIFKIRIRYSIALSEQRFPVNADEIIALRGSTPKKHRLFWMLTSCRNHHWGDTDQYRGEIRHSAQKTLKQLGAKQG